MLNRFVRRRKRHDWSGQRPAGQTELSDVTAFVSGTLTAPVAIFCRKMSICGNFSVGNPVLKLRFEEHFPDVSVEFIGLFGSPFHRFALTLRGFSEGV